MTTSKLPLELHDELKSNAPRTSWDPTAEYEPPCCSICDGQGHGYPGAGPCPLEDTMSWADKDREDWEYANLT